MEDNPFQQIADAQHRDMFTYLESLKAHGIPGLDPEIVPRMGVRVKTTEQGWVMLVREIFNWRILDCRIHPIDGVVNEASGWSRGWCYAEPHSFASSVWAAVTWSGRPETEPSGWTKSLPDQRYNSEPLEGILQE